MNRSRFFAVAMLAISACMLMSATWRTDFDKSQADALAQHKLILLKFSGSDWCIPCIRMEKEIFSDKTFQAFTDTSCIMVNADFPRTKKAQPSKEIQKQNDLLAARYNKDGHFPLTLILSPDGRVLKKWEGYAGGSPAEYIAAIKALRP